MTNNIVRGDMKTQTRIRFLKSIHAKTEHNCPECQHELDTTDEIETYCPHCGLITSATYEYCAGIRIHLPYGRKQ